MMSTPCNSANANASATFVKSVPAASRTPAAREVTNFARRLRLFVRRGRDDEHLFEAREVDGRRRDHLLVDTEVVLDHLHDRADGDALRKAPAHAARNQQVADLDLVGALHVLDAACV